MNPLPPLSLSVAAGFLSLCATFDLGGAEPPVSYYRDIVPILKQSCTGCHHAGKSKGGLDLSTHSAFLKGGKNGAAVVPGDSAQSPVIEAIRGDPPAMPDDGDPLSGAEVALIERWIMEGATDDTPPEVAQRFQLSEPPVYAVPPVISSLAFSPDGKTLAVSGYHEVLLRSADGSNLKARLVGGSPRIESMAFSPDGQRLGVAGSAPALFGEIQIWNLASNTLETSFKAGPDSVYGLSWSLDGERVAVGGADKTVRILAVKDGAELLKFDNHSDWVFGTTFTVDGKRLLTGSRDKAMKLIDVSNGQFIDDINKLLESIVCIARHPREDVVLYGGELGAVRTYKISDNQGRTAANNDVNLVREFERQPGSVHAAAYSPDGSMITVGSARGEVRIYKTGGQRVAAMKGPSGAIFALAYHPDGSPLVTGGFDGTVRMYDPANGTLIREFVPVPITAQESVAQVATPPGK